MTHPPPRREKTLQSPTTETLIGSLTEAGITLRMFIGERRARPLWKLLAFSISYCWWKWLLLFNRWYVCRGQQCGWPGIMINRCDYPWQWHVLSVAGRPWACGKLKWSVLRAGGCYSSQLWPHSVSSSSHLNQRSWEPGVSREKFWLG